MSREETKALNDAFNSEEGLTEETAETEVVVEEVEEELPPVVEEVVEEVVEPEVIEPEMIGGMTVDEFQGVVSKAKEVDDLKSTVAKLRDTMHGRLGGVEQQLKSRVDRISPKAKERMTDEFPELAEILFSEADDEVVETLPPVEKEEEVAEEVVEPDDGLTEAQRDQIKFIHRDHNDWTDVIISSEFKQFLAKKPKADQDSFNSSWEADVLSPVIKEFKDGKEAAKKSATDRAARLKSAITPRGDGTPSDHDIDDEEAAMMAGFSD